MRRRKNRAILSKACLFRLSPGPAISLSLADVLARYGEPWGTIRIQGKESLYFRGGLELVFENDVLIQVK